MVLIPETSIATGEKDYSIVISIYYLLNGYK